MTQAMEGVRIVEVASWTFVPGAGAVLADWGADVIKVEHPQYGDPQRGLVSMAVFGTGTAPPVNFMIEQPNRGKRSVGLDIATDGGRELLYRLVETADVFMTNMLPDPRRRLGIDVEDVRARNPQIIYVRGTGQGTRGADAEKDSFDATSYWARGAMAQAFTPPDSEWLIGQRPAIGDLPGAMTIAGGVAAALFHRERTGVASVVDVSLLGCAMWTLSPDILGSQYTSGRLMSFDRFAPPNPLVNQYRTADGRFLTLAMMQSDRHWAGFCEIVGHPELVDDPRFIDSGRRFENRQDCVAALDQIFGKRPLAEWREVLSSAEGAWEIYQTPGELLDDPQAIANGYLPEVEAADGSTFRVVANPVQFDEAPAQPHPAPEHGQHTEEVLLELGLSWSDISAHKTAGAIL